MKKRSILGRVAVIAMALTLATTSMMSGTLARYAMVRTATASAVIAKWNPTIKADNTAVTEVSATIDLAKTRTVNGALTSADLSNIADGNGAVRIAPGTSGEVLLTVDVKGAEVPTICEMKIKKPSGTGYTYPGHIKVWVTDTENSPTTYGKTYVGTFTDGSYSNPLTTDGDLLFGLDGTTPTAKAMLFPSAKTDKNGAAQLKNFKLHWEWPMDYDGGTSYQDGDKDTYNKNVAEAGSDAAAGTSTKFGFDLVINLQQYDSSTMSGKTQDVT